MRGPTAASHPVTRPGSRAATSPKASGAQSGYLRSYALLLVTGFAGLGLYFLLQSS